MAASCAACAGKKRESTVAAAEEVVEWPEGYEGKDGVEMYGDQLRSSEAPIAVTGRSVQYVYLAFQQAMKASAWAVPRAAKTSAARGVERPAARTSRSAIAFQWPGGVKLPSLSSQALATC